MTQQTILYSAENTILCITKTSQFMLYRAVIAVYRQNVGECKRGHERCCSLRYVYLPPRFKRRMQSTAPPCQDRIPVTAQFICHVQPYPPPCLSILRAARGWPPSLSISLCSGPQAYSKTVIQTLLVDCGSGSAARCTCGRLVVVRCKEFGRTVMKLYC
jgi:hypothetical protein